MAEAVVDDKVLSFFVVDVALLVLKKCTLAETVYVTGAAIVLTASI